MMLTNGPHPADPNQRGHCTHAAHQREHPQAHAQMPCRDHHWAHEGLINRGMVFLINAFGTFLMVSH